LGEDSVEDQGTDLDADVEESLGEPAKRALKRLREVASEKSRQARELEAKIALLEAEKPQPEKPALVRPTFEGCGFDEEKYAEAIEQYAAAKAEDEVLRKKEDEIRNQTNIDYTQRVQRYTEAKKSLQVQGYEDSEDTVRKALSTQQQSIIIRNVAEPEKLIYALGRSKKALAELAEIQDLDRFSYKIAKLETSMIVKRKGPPPPESRLAGGNSSIAASGPLKSQLEAAEKEAERTGDRTKVINLKRQMRNS
jgi:hypothetical protein